jgi:hypothetical protein
VHSIGNSHPAEARALPTTMTIKGTTAIPNPGTPLLEIPTSNAHVAPKIHCQAANDGTRTPPYTTGSWSDDHRHGPTSVQASIQANPVPGA